ncbi:hypothetical protein ACNHUS_02280 [Actinomycetes bacterium M1A6_2h]
MAAACALAAPTTASAAPVPQPLPEGESALPLSFLAPAVFAAVAAPTEVAATSNTVLAQARALLATAPLSPQTKTTLSSVITFLDGSAGGGPDIPENGPVISQFLYPTLGRGCISPTADSVGTALAVPGPAQLPPPGPGVAQAGFVFTALGTAPLAAEQPAPMTVSWVNVDTLKTGTATLTGAAKINPDGPSTLSAIADTGKGRVLAAIAGSVSTQAGLPCTFFPTVGLFVV